MLKSIDGAYTIRKAQLQDAGVYECESKNEVGSQLRSITLDVKGQSFVSFCFLIFLIAQMFQRL